MCSFFLNLNTKYNNMDKENKNTEVDNTDKKLHISDVIKRNTIECCLECVYCKLNPYGKSDDKDYTGYYCTWIGRKICDEKDLTKVSQIPNWCRKYYDL